MTKRDFKPVLVFDLIGDCYGCHRTFLINSAFIFFGPKRWFGYASIDGSA